MTHIEIFTLWLASGVIFLLSLWCCYLRLLVKSLSKDLFNANRDYNILLANDPLVQSVIRENEKLWLKLKIAQENVRMWQQAWKENQKELPPELLSCLKIPPNE